MVVGKVFHGSVLGFEVFGRVAQKSAENKRVLSVYIKMTLAVTNKVGGESKVINSGFFFLRVYRGICALELLFLWADYGFKGWVLKFF